jgi:hypothetical protein
MTTMKKPAITPRSGRYGPRDEHTVRPEFYRSVADALRRARSSAYRAVNSTMVEAYWNNPSNLKRMRQFFMLFPKGATLWHQLEDDGKGATPWYFLRRFHYLPTEQELIDEIEREKALIVREKRAPYA